MGKYFEHFAHMELLVVSVLSGACESSGASSVVPVGDIYAPGGAANESFDGCPTVRSFVGSATWPAMLAVREGTKYCSQFLGSRSFQEELSAKAELRFKPGSYRLPQNGSGLIFGLPICLALVDKTVPFDTGSIAYSQTSSDGLTTHFFNFELPLAGGETKLQSVLSVQAEQAAAVDVTLTGDHFSWTSGLYLSQLLCGADGKCDGSRLSFDACGSDSYDEYAHRIDFENGFVEFYLQLGLGNSGTSPYAFVRAAGNYSGVAFEQTDYFKLVYQGAYHHSVRHFAVLFAEPIDGVGGIEVEGLTVTPTITQAPMQIFAIDAHLVRLQEMPFSNVEITPI